VTQWSSQPRPVAIDLFCGAGGLSLGFEQAGFDILCAVDYDPIHVATHAYNLPLTKAICADLAQMSTTELRAAAEEGWNLHHPESADSWSGEIDAVFGGPPCQGFSTMGKRLLEDTRNDLIFHFQRLVCELAPKYFVMENVPGMAAGGHSELLRRLIKEFDMAGYRIVEPPAVLNASSYGVPQDRRRLFLLGAREDQPQLAYPYPITTPSGTRKKPGRRRRASQQQPLPIGLTVARVSTGPPLGPTVADALEGLPDLDSFEELLEADEVLLDEELNALAPAGSYASRLRGLENDPDDFSYRREWNPKLLTSSLRTAHTEKSIERFRSTDPGDVEPVSRFFRLPPDGLCNTLRAGTGSERGAFTSPRPIHPFLPRVISVREAARLHSFPDWFRFHVTKWHGFRQIGNAVPPLLGRAVASSVTQALSTAPSKPTKCLELGDPGLLQLNMLDAAELFNAQRQAIPKPRRRAASVL
jgi:DNA (cytosine-5)-methyltransferase 1